jgi:two-component system, chemotaxis family, sensor kinase CheA
VDDFLKEIQEGFLVEARDLLSHVESLFLQLEKNPSDLGIYEQLARLAHNFKGSGKAVGFDSLSKFSHELENLLIALKNGKREPSPGVVSLLLKSCDLLQQHLRELENNKQAVITNDPLFEALKRAQEGPELTSDAAKEAGASQTIGFKEPLVKIAKAAPAPIAASSPSEDSIRVPLDRIDGLLNLFGEQVILQSALDQARADPLGQIDQMIRTIAQLSKLTVDIQHSMLSLRMTNLQRLFSKLERAVRDTALALGKSVEFVGEGQDSELDKILVDALADPLVHMVRNAVDHGLESSEGRLEAQKPQQGTIRLKAYRGGGSFVLELRDDGRGLNRERIVKKAKEAGLLSEGADPSEEEAFSLIFENGFSTKDEATEYSGRGVGMNVVKETVERLRGSLEIESKLGEGSCFRIRLPLNLAIFHGMVMRVGKERYVIPASDVEEVVVVKPGDLTPLSQREASLRVREELFSVVDLGAAFTGRPSVGCSGKVSALLVRCGKLQRAFLVDEVLALQKVVHKAVESQSAGLKGGTGATILGDGTVAMILDLVRWSERNSGPSTDQLWCKDAG